MLNDDERSQIIAAIRYWSLRAPAVPVFAFLENGDLLTPAEVANDVQNDSTNGKGILEIIEHNLRRSSLAAIVARIRGDERTDTGGRNPSGAPLDQPPLLPDLSDPAEQFLHQQMRQANSTQEQTFRTNSAGS
jgi:hypothetical protein